MTYPATNTPRIFTPPSLGPTAGVTFLVKPTTLAEFEQLGHELFRHGISPVTSQTWRTHVIDEVFKIEAEDESDEKANLLDELWQAEDLYQERLEDWRLREDQRLLDIAGGAPHQPALPLPARTMPLRRRNAAMMYADQLAERSRRLRDLMVQMQTYNARQREGLTRLVLVGWQGLSAPFKLDERGEIVLLESFKAMEREIGPKAVDELHEFVVSLGDVSETERGNSDLPPGSASLPTGSPAPSGASAINDGYSMSEDSDTPTAPASSSSTPIQPAE
jgi:hypothetical protein